MRHNECLCFGLDGCMSSGSDYTALQQGGPQFCLFSLCICLIVSPWARWNMKRDGLQSLYSHCFGIQESPGGVWWKGSLSEPNLKKLVDIEFALSRLLIFFSLYIVKSVEKEHQLKICHSGSRPAWQILSSLLHGQASLLHVIILVLGLVQQFRYNIRGFGVWKRERAVSTTRQNLGRSVREQDACCSCPGQGFFVDATNISVLLRTWVVVSISVRMDGWF